MGLGSLGNESGPMGWVYQSRGPISFDPTQPISENLDPCLSLIRRQCLNRFYSSGETRLRQARPAVQPHRLRGADHGQQLQGGAVHVQGGGPVQRGSSQGRGYGGGCDAGVFLGQDIDSMNTFLSENRKKGKKTVTGQTKQPFSYLL